MDTGVQEGDRITPHFDPMIAKLISHGATRSEAIERMRTALSETDVGAFVCNLSFLDRLLDHPVFRQGQALTSFVAANGKDLI